MDTPGAAAGRCRLSFGGVGFLQQGGDGGALGVGDELAVGGDAGRELARRLGCAGASGRGVASRRDGPRRSVRLVPGQDFGVGHHLAGDDLVLRHHLDHRLVAVAGEEAGDSRADDPFRGDDAGPGAVLRLRLAADLLQGGPLSR